MTAQTPPRELAARCCIAGGGPAGMMLGLLLARAGVDTLVLEKHADFLRDFRGDTIHPSTLQIMDELGILDEFLRRPHQKVERLSLQVGEERVQIADFSHLPTRCRFVAFMPQWEFLDFIADHARAFPTFRLLTRTEVTGLIQNGGSVVGVEATDPDGPLRVRAGLVVGADGRRSTVRASAGLEVEDLGAPMDVLWMRISRLASDPKESFGHIEAGRMFIMLDRGDYWQCAFVIPKGSTASVQAKGIEAFQSSVRELSPWLGDRVRELASWDDVKLLTVSVDRLKTWHRPGLLCIGDAAHAMSPVGGVGINLAIQDAVAAANLLAGALQRGTPSPEQLSQVEKRRLFPTRVTQALQIAVQNRVVGRVLAATQRPVPPLAARLLNSVPWLRRIPARLVGLGVRPEHVRSPRAA